MSSVTQFLERYLDDFEKLEVAHFLWKRRAPIPRDELGESIRVPPSLLSDVLKALTASNVVVVDAAEKVRLGSRASEPSFEALMKEYDDDRFAVLSRVSRIAMDRMRAMAARAFANAFVVRKKPGG